MGNPHTVDICGNCRNPIVQWNNTGAWEHLGSGTLTQAASRAHLTGSKNLNDPTVCNSPRLLVEQNSVPSRNTANYRTAKKA